MNINWIKGNLQPNEERHIPGESNKRVLRK